MLHGLLLLAILAGIAVAIALHFLPTIIAKQRNHPNTLAIFLVNLFLGWTLIAWIIVLIWAFTTPSQPVIYAPIYPGVAPPLHPASQAASVLPSPSAPYPGQR